MIKKLMSPDFRVKMAWILFFASLILWPITTFTLASSEPPFVLGLSWFAITLTAWDIICTSDVRKEQENGEE